MSSPKKTRKETRAMRHWRQMETKTGLKLGKEDTKSLRGDQSFIQMDALGILLLSERIGRVLSGAQGEFWSKYYFCWRNL